ncbi:winged helix-turn-helix domain-containing protein [Actinocorallia lasiicapitis]
MNLDQAIHAPYRLQIVSLLAELEEAEFALVREELGISDSVISKSATVLAGAGYLEIRKGHVGRRSRTWLKLTPQGRAAFTAYLADLQRIVGRHLG